jgi:hypothetical protein
VLVIEVVEGHTGLGHRAAERLVPALWYFESGAAPPLSHQKISSSGPSVTAAAAGLVSKASP